MRRWCSPLALVAMLGATASAESLYTSRDANGTLTFTNVPTIAAHEEMALPETGEGSTAADPKGPDTPLHVAVRGGKLAQVEQLLGEGARVNARGFLGWTPLMTAAFHHRGVVAKLLIDTSTQRTTRYEYDDRNNLIKGETTGGAVTTYEYNRDNQLLRSRTRPR